MKLTATDIVRPDDERPARRDGTCFYCHQRLGTPHKPDCVIVSDAVVLRVEIDVVVDEPRSFTKENIEFRYNEGSYCCDNLLAQLGAWEEKEPEPGKCSCGAMRVSFMRSATADDMARFPVLIAREDLGDLAAPVEEEEPTTTSDPLAEAFAPLIDAFRQIPDNRRDNSPLFAIEGGRGSRPKWITVGQARALLNAWDAR